jgi:hypothetical protein
MGIKKLDLNNALNSADIHHETQGTRIEFDEDFNISAEYKESTDTIEYSAYDVSDEKVTLTDNQTTIVYNFVKALHDTEKQKQEDHKAQTL